MTATPARPQNSVASFLWFLVRLVLIVALFRSFIAATFVIPSQSMLPRLLIGDYLVVTKWNYGYSRHSLPFSLPLIPGRIFPQTPERGDIVVFRAVDDHADVIKRVIGLPGDTVQMRGGQLILNGVAIPKKRIADFVIPLTPNYDESECPEAFRATDSAGRAVCRYQRFTETLPSGRSYDVLDRGYYPIADDTDVYTVPPGNVFVMGDNRDDSGDSRFPIPEGQGYIPLERIEGRAWVMFFSTDGTASWFLPWTWFSAARWSRIGGGF